VPRAITGEDDRFFTRPEAHVTDEHAEQFIVVLCDEIQ
jgi:hypothetical protein